MSLCVTDAITGTDPTGQLTVNGTLMHGPAWKLLDLRPLWLPATLRGSDVLVPGVSGVLPYRRRSTETTVVLPGVITGAVDRNGTPNTDQWAGLQANIDDLAATVLGPSDAGIGWDASLLMPDGSTRTGLVNNVVLDLGEYAAKTATHRVTLTVTLPDGALVSTGAPPVTGSITVGGVPTMGGFQAGILALSGDTTWDYTLKTFTYDPSVGARPSLPGPSDVGWVTVSDYSGIPSGAFEPAPNLAWSDSAYAADQSIYYWATLTGSSVPAAHFEVYYYIDLPSLDGPTQSPGYFAASVNGTTWALVVSQP